MQLTRREMTQLHSSFLGDCWSVLTTLHALFITSFVDLSLPRPFSRMHIIWLLEVNMVPPAARLHFLTASRSILCIHPGEMCQLLNHQANMRVLPLELDIRVWLRYSSLFALTKNETYLPGVYGYMHFVIWFQTKMSLRLSLSQTQLFSQSVQVTKGFMDSQAFRKY